MPALPPAGPESPRLAGEAAGALNGAATSFATTVAGGTLIFAPLGAEWIPSGIVACLVAACTGGLLASLFSSLPVSISSPRASVCIVLAGLVAALHRNSPQLSPAAVMALASLTVVAAGAIQVGAAALRLGRLIRFVPFPVISGFTHGVALTLLVVYVPILAGISEVPRRALPTFSFFHWGAPIVGLATLGGILLAMRIRKTLPSSFLGFAAGVGTYFALAHLVPGFDAGAAVSPGAAPLVDSPFAQWSALPPVMREPGTASLLITFSIALACIASIDSMVGTMALEARQTTRSDPDRDLFAQGVGNLLSGALGGGAIAYSMVQVQAAQAAGGRTRAIGPASSLGVAAIAVGCAVFLDSVPLAVLAGLMLFIASRLADPWGFALLRAAREKGAAGEALRRESLIVYLLVALSIVFLDIVAALAVGLAASAVIFVRTMNESVVRAVRIGAAIRSRRLVSPDAQLVLAGAIHRVALVELQGSLFFGTSDRIAVAVEKLPADVRYVVLDLTRVHGLDATATAVLTRVNARLGTEKRMLLRAGGPAGIAALTGDLPRHFPDQDRALEWVEDRLLADTGHRETTGPLEPADAARAFDLDEGEAEVLLQSSQVRELRAGEALFREGDGGDAFYFLLAGRLSICHGNPDAPRARVVTYLPGNTFGDVAFVDRRPRSADAVCDTDCRLLMVTAETVAALRARSPETVSRLYAAMARNIAGRLRELDAIAHADEES